MELEEPTESAANPSVYANPEFDGPDLAVGQIRLVLWRSEARPVISLGQSSTQARHLALVIPSGPRDVADHSP